MHRIDLQKCDPHRGRKHFFKKRVKNIASGGKRAQKVGARRCYAYVGGFGVLKKSPKWRTSGEKTAQRRHLWRKSSEHDALGVKQLPTSVVLPPPGGPESGFLASKCTGLICKNVIPTEAGSIFSKKEWKWLQVLEKGQQKWELENVMRMLGALVGW